MPATSGRLSLDLVRCAARRIEHSTKRSEADLRRAVSDLYYALFHAVCEELAKLAPGEIGDPSFKEVYRSLYRWPNHGPLLQKCQEIQKNKDISPDLKRFAQLFATMKGKRDIADYDPTARISGSEVENDVIITTYALSDFFEGQEKLRQQFVLLLTIDAKRSK